MNIFSSPAEEQGDSGSRTNAQTNGMCNRGIAQSEKHSCWQTSEEPWSSAQRFPLQHLPNISEAQHLATRKLEGEECVNNSLNPELPHVFKWVFNDGPGKLGNLSCPL